MTSVFQSLWLILSTVTMVALHNTRGLRGVVLPWNSNSLSTEGFMDHHNVVNMIEMKVT
jgi:hypothetical protein